MKTEALPRVSVVDALGTGLVEAARRPWLVMVPLLSQLLLWLAPPVSIAGMIDSFVNWWEKMLRAYSPAQVTSLSDMVTSVREMAGQLGRSVNLVDGITGSWLGAPVAGAPVHATRMTFISDLVLAPVMAIRLPEVARAPWLGSPIPVSDLGTLLVVVLAFWVLGQLLLAVYLREAASSWRKNPPVPADSPEGKALRRTGQAEGAKRVETWAGLRGLLALAARLAGYGILLSITVAVLQLPLAFALSLMWVTSSPALGMLMLMLSGVALWLTLWFLVSLYFAGEGIILDGQPVLRSIVRSIVLVHNNFWATLSLAVVVNVLVFGFRAVWGLIGLHPAGAAISIVMNAYLSTGLLLGIFAFYDRLAKQAFSRRVVGSRT